MSGFLKSVGKVFKKIVKSPIFKVVAIAAAVYFTGGLAAGAMGSTFAAGLPGISGLASSLGVTAGAFGASAAEGAATLAAGALGAAQAGLEAGTVVGAGESALAAGAAGSAAMGAEGAMAGTLSAGAAGAVQAGAEAAGAITGGGVTSAAAQTALGAAGSSGASGIFGSLASTFNGMSPMAQKMVLEGVSQGGKALIGGLAQKNQQDFEQQQIDATRADRNNREKPVDIPAGVFSKGSNTSAGNTSGYKTPGVIQSAMKLPDISSPQQPQPQPGA